MNASSPPTCSGSTPREILYRCGLLATRRERCRRPLTGSKLAWLGERQPTSGPLRYVLGCARQSRSRRPTLLPPLGPDTFRKGAFARGNPDSAAASFNRGM